ncbi:putative manganese transporter [Gemmatimonadota bacterium]
MVTLLRDALPSALMITGFVFIMMVLIEYLNVQTRGWWQEGLKNSGWRQYAVASALGAVPGCLGAFTVVSLYAHGALSFGALVGTMVATSGDEAFVMLAMFPGRALIFTAGFFALGWAVAFSTDRFLPGFAPALSDSHELRVHEVEECHCFQPRAILGQLHAMTFSRALLLVLFALFLLGMLSGCFGPAEWNWIRVTMTGSGLFALFVAATVPDHFLEEHLWEHVLKSHLLRIFSWTFGALFVIQVLGVFMDMESWIQGNVLAVLLIASLVGLVPESGPHLAFVTLYAQGVLPLGVLVASSIVQDGHGALPLLAVSKCAFVRLKLINLVAGLAVGGLVLLLVG